MFLRKQNFIQIPGKYWLSIHNECVTEIHMPYMYTDQIDNT